MIDGKKKRIIAGVITATLDGVFYTSLAVSGNLGALGDLNIGYQFLVGLGTFLVAGGAGVVIETVRQKRADEKYALETKLLDDSVQKAAAIDNIGNAPEPNFSSTYTRITADLPVEEFDMKKHAEKCNKLLEFFAQNIVPNNAKNFSYQQVAEQYRAEWDAVYPEGTDQEYLEMLRAEKRKGKNCYTSMMIPSVAVAQVQPKASKHGNMTDVECSSVESSREQRPDSEQTHINIKPQSGYSAVGNRQL